MPSAYRLSARRQHALPHGSILRPTLACWGAIAMDHARAESRLSRRAFVVGAGATALLAGCGRPPWQGQAPKIPRVGFISLGAMAGTSNYEAFRAGLRDLGYVEDQN